MRSYDVDFFYYYTGMKMNALGAKETRDALSFPFDMLQSWNNTFKISIDCSKYFHDRMRSCDTSFLPLMLLTN
jgi:hypothetical protein